MSVFWAVSNNVGDAWVAYLYRKLTGKLPVWAKPQESGYVLGGSVLNHAGPHTICWGAGLASLRDEVHPDADIRSFRGPLSRTIAMASGNMGPEIYGDSSMIAPDLLSTRRNGKPLRQPLHKLGVIPHYVDMQRTWAWHQDAQDTGGVKLINVFAPVEEFIEEVNSCTRIVSSSLHGLVFAHAYGIPALWVKISDSIGGDGSKYRDHLMAMGMDVYAPVDCRSGFPTVGELCNRVDALGPVPEFDRAPLWAAMPEELRGAR